MKPKVSAKCYGKEKSENELRDLRVITCSEFPFGLGFLIDASLLEIICQHHPKPYGWWLCVRVIVSKVGWHFLAWICDTLRIRSCLANRQTQASQQSICCWLVSHLSLSNRIVWTDLACTDSPGFLVWQTVPPDRHVYCRVVPVCAEHNIEKREQIKTKWN